MSGQPVQEHDPDDPLGILRMLPERFPSEHATAAGYSEPGFEGRLGSLRELVPGWSGRLNQR
jgi:hypothetical protein